MDRRRFLTGMGGGALAAVAGASAGTAASASLASALPPDSVRTHQRGDFTVTLGPERVVMRGPMFPTMARVAPETIVLFAQAVEEGGPLTAIRSESIGDTWRPADPAVTGMGLNTFRLSTGKVVSIHYETTAVPGTPGLRTTKRWESTDAWKTAMGPLEDGTLRLPPGEFDDGRPQWFHGNTIELPDGRLIAAMQDFRTPSEFRTFVSQSDDGGVTWEFLAHVGSLENIDDPEGKTRTGWTLWGPVEPNIVHLGEGRLVCVTRLVNDDANPLMAEPADSYRDLSYTVAGTGIHPGTLPADQYYVPGPPSAPLVISYSDDFGATWSKPVPMRQARGCFPRMALSGDLIALTYGGLAYPRWGNCITFSKDGGKTWTDEINFGPYLTTGYTDVQTIGPNRFLCVFDCTPPQPWANHAAHWVGAVDISVR